MGVPDVAIRHLMMNRMVNILEAFDSIDPVIAGPTPSPRMIF